MICNNSATALKRSLGFSFLIDVSMCSKFKHTLTNVKNRLVYNAATGQMREYGAQGVPTVLVLCGLRKTCQHQAYV